MALLFTLSRSVQTDSVGQLMSGWTVEFYQTGTSNPKTVYADAALSQPLGVSVQAGDDGSLKPIYLDDSGSAYKIIIKDANGATVPNGTIDPYLIGPSQAQIGTALYPRTAAEISAGLIPTNFAYDFGNARRYGFDPTGVIDCAPLWTTALKAVYDGVPLYFPAGVYRFDSGISTAKPYRTTLIGDWNSAYGENAGTRFKFYGSGVALTVGSEDGNPDSTGFTRDFYAHGIMFIRDTVAGTATTGIYVVNTALAQIEHCKFRYFTSKQIHLRGGNVIVTINDNDIAGVATGSDVCIYMDDYQFGNYVTHVQRNHIFQADYAARFAEGRYLNWTDNTVENINTHTYLFETAGYISHALFNKNYHETTDGYAFKGASFTGLILKLVVTNNEFWASGDAADVNPGFGDFDRNRVIECDFRDNWIATSARNTVATLGLPATYPDTHLFSIGTTAVRGEPENFEHEDWLARTFRGNDLLGVAGDFCAVTATPEPFGWTDATGAGTWAATASEIIGGPVCNVPSAGDSDMATKVVSLTPANRTRYFVVGLTYKGWSAYRIDGNLIFDAGSNVANYATNVSTFSLAANASSFTVLLARNASNPCWFAEMRIFEIGSAEFNSPSPGTLGSALVNAVKRTMLRGGR